VSLKKNLFYNVILSVSNIIFPVISFPYAARVLGPEGTGVANFAQSFCQYFTFFAALGIPVYGVREIAKVRDDVTARCKLFWELNIIRLGASLIVLIPYLILIFTVGKLEANLVMFLWGGIFILMNVTSMEWFFSGLEDFRYITIRSVLVKFLSLIILFAFVRKPSDVLIYFLINLFVLLLNGFFNIKYASKYIRWKSFDFSLFTFRHHFKPLIIIFWGIFAITVYVFLDTIILGFMSTNKAVGLYSASTKISKLSLTIITALGTVLVPRLSYAVSKNNKKEIDRLLSHSFNFVFTIGIPIALGTFMMASEITTVFSGKQFADSVISLQIMSPIVVIIGLASIFSVQILTPLAKDKYVMYGAIIGAVLSIVLNFILIPFFNQNGAAISYVVAELIVTVVAYRYSSKFLEFRIDLSLFVFPLLISLGFFPIFWLARMLFPSNSLYIIVFTVILSCIFYVSLQLWVFKNRIISELVSSTTNLFYKKTILE
jgi:O-antigen/teichoic acid export membrane protein